eukprot:2545574-Pyramimonas_sp.AAC.1
MPRLNAPETCSAFMKAWARSGYDAYQMDHELGLGIHWVEVRRKHMNFPVRHDAPAHAPRAPSGRDTPAPWTAEGRKVVRTAARGPWAGAIGTAIPDQWRGWQG